MIETAIALPPAVPKWPQFPLLAKARGDGERIVLFTSPRTGTVVCDESNRDIGLHHEDGWESCLDECHWEILPPGARVTLEAA